MARLVYGHAMNRNLPFLARFALLSAIALAAPGVASAAPVVGQPAPDFTLTDINGQTHRLSDYKGKIVVLEWTNPECPIVGKHYNSGNMPSLQKSATAEGVVWLSINSGSPGSQGDFDKPAVEAWLKSHAAAPTAYFRDQDGKVGHLYHATATPNMFVIRADGTLAYAGAIDSIASANQADIARATNYVRIALDAVKAGRPVPVSTSRPYGCSVKY
jgi:AhpC/TSA family